MKIVVPLDGSELAETAIPEAIEMARRGGGEIVLVRVGELPETSDHATEERGALEAALGRVKAGITEVPVSIYVDMSGDPAHGIALAVDDEQADRIVMSTHGRSGLTYLAHGSVADEVLRHARVPVTLVRPGPRSAA